jgi:hypothetical protein
MACGGLEFDHQADWSKGLGYLFESEFEFLKADRFHWNVDLARVSPYTKNSTQTDVYCAGSRYEIQPKKIERPTSNRQIINDHLKNLKNT